MYFIHRIRAGKDNVPRHIVVIIQHEGKKRLHLLPGTKQRDYVIRFKYTDTSVCMNACENNLKGHIRVQSENVVAQ